MTTDLSAGTEEYALFLPAINDNYAKFPFGDTPRPMPNDLSVADLNYLDPGNRLFRYRACLHSAAFGVYTDCDTIISQRQREATTVVGDSGGFTLISADVRDPLDVFRAKSLRWQEKHCDVGIILDIPTRAIDRPDTKFPTFQDCLDVTEASIKYAIEKRQA